jgi:hypothetical protein
MNDGQWFAYDKRVYRWDGGFGSIFSSEERGVPQGALRMIAGKPFYAHLSESRWWRKGRVCWTLPDVSAEFIRVLRAELFGVRLWELTNDVAAVDPHVGASSE